MRKNDHSKLVKVFGKAYWQYKDQILNYTDEMMDNAELLYALFTEIGAEIIKLETDSFTLTIEKHQDHENDIPPGQSPTGSQPERN